MIPIPVEVATVGGEISRSTTRTPRVRPELHDRGGQGQQGRHPDHRLQRGKKGGVVSPEGYFRQAMNNMDSIFKDAQSMSFSGSYPDSLVSWMNIPYDRGGYGEGPTLKWSPSGWDTGGGMRTSPRASCGVARSIP